MEFCKLCGYCLCTVYMYILFSLSNFQVSYETSNCVAVESCFSAMKLVETFLRNRLNDDSLSDELMMLFVMWRKKK